MRSFVLRGLAVSVFALAAAAILATLFYGPESSLSPGLFSAVVLGWVGTWLWGKAAGKRPSELVGKPIEVRHAADHETPAAPETDDQGSRSGLDASASDGPRDR